MIFAWWSSVRTKLRGRGWVQRDNGSTYSVAPNSELIIPRYTMYWSPVGPDAPNADTDRPNVVTAIPSHIGLEMLLRKKTEESSADVQVMDE